MKNRVSGTVKSEKGFYVGDPCYALNDKVYETIIMDIAKCQDGIYTEPATGYSVAFAGTAYGDGTYEDAYSFRTFDVDAGIIGVVPGELVEDTDGGHYFEGAGEATFTAEDGIFTIMLPSGEEIHLNTADNTWDEEEDDYYEEEDEED